MSRDKDTGWIEINPSEINTKRAVMIRGQKVEVFISPYNVPRQIRAVFDPDATTLKILLKYLNEEETSEYKIDDRVVYNFGKFSKRLYSIEFSLDRMLTENKHNLSTRDGFLSALKKLVDVPTAERDQSNLEVAEMVIRASESQVLQAAA